MIRGRIVGFRQTDLTVITLITLLTPLIIKQKVIWVATATVFIGSKTKVIWVATAAVFIASKTKVIWVATATVFIGFKTKVIWVATATVCNFLQRKLKPYSPCLCTLGHVLLRELTLAEKLKINRLTICL